VVLRMQAHPPALVRTSLPACHAAHSHLRPCRYIKTIGADANLFVDHSQVGGHLMGLCPCCTS